MGSSSNNCYCGATALVNCTQHCLFVVTVTRTGLATQPDCRCCVLRAGHAMHEGVETLVESLRVCFRPANALLVDTAGGGVLQLRVCLAFTAGSSTRWHCSSAQQEGREDRATNTAGCQHVCTHMFHTSHCPAQWPQGQGCATPQCIQLTGCLCRTSTHYGWQLPAVHPDALATCACSQQCRVLPCSHQTRQAPRGLWR